jgi:hypothetical protein
VNKYLGGTLENQEMVKVVSAYRSIFDLPAGVIVLHDLMKVGNVLNTSFTKDPYETAFNEGARSVVLRIMETISLDFEKFLKSVEEVTSEGFYE